MEFENYKPNSLSELLDKEKELESLLNDPENAFLSEIPANRKAIDDFDTTDEALRFAYLKIDERLSRTFQFNFMSPIEGISLAAVNYKGIRTVINIIKKHQEKIGEGQDAIVVIDKNEIRNLPPEVCYKFIKREATPRGRNSLLQEAELQSRAYEIVTKSSELNIGIPSPFYTLEMGQDKVFAMEKLKAKSVSDILRSKGTVPKWFNKGVFLDGVEKTISKLQENGFYHRDLHTGNIMISQTEEEPEKWGYIIDFGLSGTGLDGSDPYKKEVAGKTFTFRNDSVIIFELERVFANYRKGI